MKAVMVMFDSLNRHFLPAYGCGWVHAPNFLRLAQRCVTFDNAYVGSMPCMPARREIHTGRYNFLHRSWGPLEPFDDSMPQILRKRGVYSHLTSDHYHYWEEGGANYHCRYSSWEASRGQEGDPWIGQVDEPPPPRRVGHWRRHDETARAYMDCEDRQPQTVTFDRGCEFLRRNARSDNWLLHIETFDPHEPFFVQPKYRDLYPPRRGELPFDWPRGGKVTESPEQVEDARHHYAALVSMCDAQLGRVLDLIDSLDLWHDTMLIVNTDHGFLLGEHGCWAKCVVPFYNEIAHMPLFVWDPRSKRAGVRRQALVQTIDLPATLLEYFGVALPPDMQGVPLRQTILDDRPVRQAALFGMFGCHVNVTDGRHLYMRANVRGDNQPSYEHTLMPAHMNRPFDVQDFRAMESRPPFSFTKGCRVMRIPSQPWVNARDWGTMLFDLQADPRQERPIRDPALEQQMIAHMVQLMQQNDAPLEEYQRLGLPLPSNSS